MRSDEGALTRLAGLLARLLLSVYPRALRSEMGAAVVRDVRERAADLRCRRGRLAAALWLPRLSVSLLTNALG